LGLILREAPDRQTTHTFQSLVIEGASYTARLNGFKLLVEVVPDNTPPDDYFNLVSEGHVDGIVLTAVRTDDVQLIESLANKIPVVVWGKIPGNVPFVDVENEGAAKMAVEHLIAQGHQRIACITFAPPDYLGPIDRVRGYRAAMDSHNLTCDDTLIRYGHWDEHSGFEAMLSLVTLPDRPTAVFVASDELAIGALRAARSLGIRVPQDVAIVGFDDVPIAQRVTPSLTTVRLPIRELGVVAAEMLIEMIQTGNRLASRFLQTNLVIRESSIGVRAG
jgi:DNA-binding LacI/PurR family transcriptional regulator